MDHPQALAFLGDTLVVASTGYATPTWGAGSVAFFDVEGARLGSVQPTRWQNPQGLAVHDGRVLVASTGVYDFSGDVPRMATPGGVEIFDPDHPATDRARSPSTSAPTAGRAAPSTGRRGRPALHLVGHRPRVHVYDLARQIWVRAPTTPSSTARAPWASAPWRRTAGGSSWSTTTRTGCTSSTPGRASPGRAASISVRAPSSRGEGAAPGGG
ncbi:MAG: hypothetical protein R3F43_04395 [bacterium]